MIQSINDRTKPESNAFCRQKNQLTCSQLITLHCMLIVSPSHGNASHKCIFGHYAGVTFNTIMYSILFPVLAGFSKYSHIMPTSSNHGNCYCMNIPHIYHRRCVVRQQRVKFTGYWSWERVPGVLLFKKLAVKMCSHCCSTHIVPTWNTAVSGQLPSSALL